MNWDLIGTIALGGICVWQWFEIRSHRKAVVLLAEALHVLDKDTDKLVQAVNSAMDALKDARFDDAHTLFLDELKRQMKE